MHFKFCWLDWFSLEPIFCNMAVFRISLIMLSLTHRKEQNTLKECCILWKKSVQLKQNMLPSWSEWICLWQNMGYVIGILLLYVQLCMPMTRGVNRLSIIQNSIEKNDYRLWMTIIDNRNLPWRDTGFTYLLTSLRLLIFGLLYYISMLLIFNISFELFNHLISLNNTLSYKLHISCVAFSLLMK